MATAVAREEDHPSAGETADAVRVGRRAERRLDLLPLDVGQPLELVQAAAADDTDRGLARERFHRSFAPVASSSPSTRSPCTAVTRALASVRMSDGGPEKTIST